MRVTLHFVITVRCVSHNDTAILGFGMKCRFNLAAAILGVPLINDVLEGCKFVVAVIGVHIVVYSDKSDVMLRKENFRVVACLQILSAKTGQILYKHRSDNAVFDVPNHSLEIGTGHGTNNSLSYWYIRTAEAVVDIEVVVGFAHIFNVFLQHHSLILYTLAVPDLLIITAESAIYGCSFAVHFNTCPFLYLGGIMNCAKNRAKTCVYGFCEDFLSTIQFRISTEQQIY